jgi:hypothetical protein
MSTPRALAAPLDATLLSANGRQELEDQTLDAGVLVRDERAADRFDGDERRYFQASSDGGASWFNYRT